MLSEATVVLFVFSDFSVILWHVMLIFVFVVVI